MHDPSVIEIDLAAIRHNVRLLRRIIGSGCAICPVVKADAYGLGAVPIARCLSDAGVDMLAVYTPQQADELLRSDVAAPVLVLMPVREVRPGSAVGRALASGHVHLKEGEVVKFGWTVEDCRALDEYRA